MRCSILSSKFQLEKKKDILVIKTSTSETGSLRSNEHPDISISICVQTG